MHELLARFPQPALGSELVGLRKDLGISVNEVVRDAHCVPFWDCDIRRRDVEAALRDPSRQTAWDEGSVA
jgi:hypothetical protein